MITCTNISLYSLTYNALDLVFADMVDEFLHETGARPKLKQPSYRPPQTFRMDSILQEMQGLHETQAKNV